MLDVADSKTATLVGNGASGLLKENLTVTSSSTTSFGATAQIGMTAQTSGGTLGNAALYAGVEAKPGTGNAWVINPCMTIDSTAGTNSHAFQAVEIDLNNNDVAATGATLVNGLSLSGAGSARCWAAVGVYGNLSGGGAQWTYGLLAGANNSCSVAGVAVQGNSTYAVDTQAFTGTSAIRLPNNIPIVGRNAANNADVSLMIIDGSNNCYLGLGAAAVLLPGSVAIGNVITNTIIKAGEWQDSNFDEQTITTGGSYTVPVTDNVVNLHAAGTIAVFTVVLPGAPADGQVIVIVTDQIITALTISPNSGQTIRGAVTTLPLAGRASYRYHGADAIWRPY